MDAWIVAGPGQQRHRARLCHHRGPDLCCPLYLAVFSRIFLLGASAGAIVATALFHAAGNQPQPILVLVIAIVFGVIELVLQKFMIIVSTAFIESYLVTAGVLHLLAGGQNVSPLWFDHLQQGSAGILGYAALVVWLILGLGGASFQYRSRRRREEATRNKTRSA